MRAVNFWPFFWIVAICAVLTLALLDNWERIQVWARKFRARINGDIPARDIPVTASGARANGFGSSRAKVTVSATAQTKAAPHKTSTKPDKARFMVHYARELCAFLWRWKVPLLFLAGFVVIAFTFSGCVPDWGKSKDTLRAERDAAMIDKTVADHEADVATKAVELAEETHADTARVRAIVERADEELADAVSQEDFDLLWRVYARNYCGVFNDPECAGGPDPAPAGADPLRGPEPDRA